MRYVVVMQAVFFGGERNKDTLSLHLTIRLVNSSPYVLRCVNLGTYAALLPHVVCSRQVPQIVTLS